MDGTNRHFAHNKNIHVQVLPVCINTHLSTQHKTAQSIYMHVYTLIGVSNLLRFVLCFIVIVSESSVATFAPGVQAAVVKDTGRVGGATLDLHHTLALHGFNQPWSVHITAQHRTQQHTHFIQPHLSESRCIYRCAYQYFLKALQNLHTVFSPLSKS